MKSKKITSIVVAVIILIGCVVGAFLYFDSNKISKEDCEKVIADIQAISSEDQLYEPPRQYFECLDVIQAE